MLSWTLIFFIIAMIATALGFAGIASAATGVAKLLFFGFLMLAVVVILSGRGRGLLT